MPTLQELLENKNPKFKLKHFHLPKFIYGDVTKSGEGVLVLEDLSPFGFETFDSVTTLMPFQVLKASVKALAEFHAICAVFDEKLREMFPIFDAKKLMWVQTDMLIFLKKVRFSMLQWRPEISVHPTFY